MAGRPLILVVEDERDIADAVAARLRSESADVEIADDGPSAVARCEELRPDLVILDLMRGTSARPALTLPATSSAPRALRVRAGGRWRRAPVRRSR